MVFAQNSTMRLEPIFTAVRLQSFPLPAADGCALRPRRSGALPGCIVALLMLVASAAAADGPEHHRIDLGSHNGVEATFRVRTEEATSDHLGTHIILRLGNVNHRLYRGLGDAPARSYRARLNGDTLVLRYPCAGRFDPPDQECIERWDLSRRRPRRLSRRQRSPWSENLERLDAALAAGDLEAARLILRQLPELASAQGDPGNMLFERYLEGLLGFAETRSAGEASAILVEALSAPALEVHHREAGALRLCLDDQDCSLHLEDTETLRASLRRTLTLLGNSEDAANWRARLQSLLDH